MKPPRPPFARIIMQSFRVDPLQGRRSLKLQRGPILAREYHGLFFTQHPHDIDDLATGKAQTTPRAPIGLQDIYMSIS